MKYTTLFLVLVLTACGAHTDLYKAKVLRHHIDPGFMSYYQSGNFQMPIENPARYYLIVAQGNNCWQIDVTPDQFYYTKDGDMILFER